MGKKDDYEHMKDRQEAAATSHNPMATKDAFINSVGHSGKWISTLGPYPSELPNGCHESR